MKYLLLFFISFSLFAGYVAPNKSGFFKSRHRCDLKHSTICYYVEYQKGLNTFDYDLSDEFVNDLENPIYSKTQIEICDGQDDCEFKLGEKVCLIEFEQPLINGEYTETYCSKLLYYEQKLSGNKVLKLNQDKKDSRLAKVKADNDKIKKDKLEKDVAIKYLKKVDCSLLSDEFLKNVCIALGK